MNERKARAILYERSGHVCEMCGRARATNAHHRRNRSQGGRWSPENLLHVCGTGATKCHGLITCNPAIAKERGWSVSAYADPAETPVWLANRGWHLLKADGSIEPTERNAA